MKRLHSIFLLFVLLCSTRTANAQMFVSQKYGFAIDLPEAFSIETQDSDEKGYLFKHSFFPVTVIVKVYDDNRYPSVATAMDDMLEKLNGQADAEEFTWRNTQCCLASFSMQLPGTDGQTGWATTISLSNSKAILGVLCYTDQSMKIKCHQFMTSIIDSIIIDRGSLYEPGLLTTFSYPATKKKNITLQIHNKKINTTIDEEDAEANKWIVDREYAILTAYAGHINWKEAWQRYYRIIFRDAYTRLKPAATAINQALYPTAIKENKSNPEAAIAQYLLTWIQDFEYKRDAKNADFTNLIATLTGEGNDCDSRSLLLCALMQHTGIQTVLFISNEYKHAVAGLALDIPGAKITVNKTPYVLAETTAHVPIGLIDQNMSNTDKWIPVLLP
ncbi:MAG: hypothetical protein K6E51_06500 [Treponema sp.]|nr:hypothetical protein [Treponema sp.]